MTTSIKKGGGDRNAAEDCEGWDAKAANQEDTGVRANIMLRVSVILSCGCKQGQPCFQAEGHKLRRSAIF